MRRLTSAICGVAFAAAAVMPVVSAHAMEMRDEDVIAYRQEIMKTMGAQAAAIGQILAGMVPDNQLYTHFEVLLLSVQQAKQAFEHPVEGGNALPVVWEKWDEFSGKLDEAEENMKKAIEIAKKDGAGGQSGEAAVAALSCKGCHDTFKKP